MKLKLMAGMLVLFFAAPAADAGWFSWLSLSKDKRRLPKPIDSPVPRTKVREDHKAGKQAGKHPPEASLTLRTTLPRA